MLRTGAALVAVAALVLAAGGMPAARQAGADASAGPILVASLDGIIHPIAAEYLNDVVTRARTADARAVIITLETPGGLLESTRGIVSTIVGSPVPVVVFVGPAGARAASAGFLITIAADVAVMAPGHRIGAAHPVAGPGATMDDTMSRKVAADAAAYARSLAGARGRNVTLAEQAVTESRAFTEEEALAADPPLIDFTAPDVDAVIAALDGRTIRRFDGGTMTLQTEGVAVEHMEMTWRQRFLSALAHPQVASYLLTLGILGLTVELWSPGLILPGVAGGLCLLLAFFAFQVLPVSTTGLLLVIFGLGLLVLELKMPSFGALGIGGAIGLVVGSVMMTRTVPGVDVSLALVVPVALGIAIIFLFLGRLALGAQLKPSVTGAEAMIGMAARTREPLAPGRPGLVDVRGEVWRARAESAIAAGRDTRVVGIEGLTLLVEPDEDRPVIGGP